MATPIPPNRASFTVDEVALVTGGVRAEGAGTGSGPVGFTTDSRAVTPGGAFLALRGDHHDGHDHLADARARGASLLVVAAGHGRPLPPLGAVDLVEVPDTRRAWGDLAAEHLRRWRAARGNTKVIALTGSAGKTTTKEIARALFTSASPAAACHATAGNLNNLVGLPAVVLGLEKAHRFAVLEMGMSEPGEIAALTGIAPPDVAILLNVGLAHAAAFGGVASGIAREKGAIYDGLAPGGVAVVNADDPLVIAEAGRAREATRVTFGRHPDADYRLLERDAFAEGRGARLHLARRGAPFTVEFPLPGEAAALDLLAALAAVEACVGPLTDPDLARALAPLRAPGGRATVRHLGDGTLLLDDTYNANPSSMRAALATLAELARARPPARRMIAVLGAMKELGAAEDAEHDAVGEAVAQAGVAVVVGVAGAASRIVHRAQRAGVEAHFAEDAAAAATLASTLVQPGDAVLVKGSRSVKTERVVEALLQLRGLAPEENS